MSEDFEIRFSEQGAKDVVARMREINAAATEAAVKTEDLSDTLARVKQKADPAQHAYEQLAKNLDILSRSQEKNLITAGQQDRMSANLIRGAEAQLRPVSSLIAGIQAETKAWEQNTSVRSASLRTLQQQQTLQRQGVALNAEEVASLERVNLAYTQQRETKLQEEANDRRAAQAAIANARLVEQGIRSFNTAQAERTRTVAGIIEGLDRETAATQQNAVERSASLAVLQTEQQLKRQGIFLNEEEMASLTNSTRALIERRAAVAEAEAEERKAATVQAANLRAVESGIVSFNQSQAANLRTVEELISGITRETEALKLKDSERKAALDTLRQEQQLQRQGIILTEEQSAALSRANIARAEQVLSNRKEDVNKGNAATQSKQIEQGIQNFNRLQVERAQSYTNLLTKIKEESAALGQNTGEREASIRTINQVDALKRRGISLTGDEIAALERENAVYVEQRAQISETARVKRQLAQVQSIGGNPIIEARNRLASSTSTVSRAADLGLIGTDEAIALQNRLKQAFADQTDPLVRTSRLLAERQEYQTGLFSSGRALAQVERDVARAAELGVFSNEADIKALRAKAIEIDHVEAAYARVNKARGLFDSTIGGIGLLFGAGALIHSLDTIQNIQNVLSVTSKGQGNQRDVSEGVYKVALDTHSAVEDTARLYGRLNLSLEKFGYGQQTVLNLTKEVNEQIRLSGTTNGENTRAVLDFAHAIASGNVQFRELRAITTQAPFISKSIAEGLTKLAELDEGFRKRAEKAGVNVSKGIGVGDLKELTSKRALVSSDIVKAEQLQAEETQKAFEKLTPTISQSLTDVRTAFLHFLNDFNQGTGVARGFSNVIEFVAHNMDTLAASVGILGGALFGVFVKNVIQDAITFTGIFGGKLALMGEKFGITKVKAVEGATGLDINTAAVATNSTEIEIQTGILAANAKAFDANSAAVGRNAATREGADLVGVGGKSKKAAKAGIAAETDGALLAEEAGAAGAGAGAGSFVSKLFTKKAPKIGTANVARALTTEEIGAAGAGLAGAGEAAAGVEGIVAAGAGLGGVSAAVAGIGGAIAATGGALLAALPLILAAGAAWLLLKDNVKLANDQVLLYKDEGVTKAIEGNITLGDVVGGIWDGLTDKAGRTAKAQAEAAEKAKKAGIDGAKATEQAQKDSQDAAIKAFDKTGDAFDSLNSNLIKGIINFIVFTKRATAEIGIAFKDVALQISSVFLTAIQFVTNLIVDLYNTTVVPLLNKAKAVGIGEGATPLTRTTVGDDFNRQHKNDTANDERNANAQVNRDRQALALAVQTAAARRQSGRGNLSDAPGEDSDINTKTKEKKSKLENEFDSLLKKVLPAVSAIHEFTEAMETLQKAASKGLVSKTANEYNSYSKAHPELGLGSISASELSANIKSNAQRELVDKINPAQAFARNEQNKRDNLNIVNPSDRELASKISAEEEKEAKALGQTVEQFKKKHAEMDQSIRDEIKLTDVTELRVKASDAIQSEDQKRVLQLGQLGKGKDLIRAESEAYAVYGEQIKKGIPGAREAYELRVRDNLSFNQYVDAVDKANEELNRIKGTTDQYNSTIRGLNLLIDQGRISLDEYNRALRDVADQQLNGSIKAADGAKQAIYGIKKESEDAAADTKRIFEDLYHNLESGFQDIFNGNIFKAGGLKSALHKVFEGLTNDLSSALFHKVTDPLIGKIGEAFGIKGFGQAKPDGTATNPLHVTVVGQGGIGSGETAPDYSKLFGLDAANSNLPPTANDNDIFSNGLSNLFGTGTGPIQNPNYGGITGGLLNNLGGLGSAGSNGGIDFGSAIGSLFSSGGGAGAGGLDSVFSGGLDSVFSGGLGKVLGGLGAGGGGLSSLLGGLGGATGGLGGLLGGATGGLLAGATGGLGGLLAGGLGGLFGGHHKGGAGGTQAPVPVTIVGSDGSSGGLSSLFGGGGGLSSLLGGGGGLSSLLGGGGGLSSLLGGGGAAAGGSGIFSTIMQFLPLFGFRDGGSFDVPGHGGSDSKIVAFKASPGENVTVATPNQQKSANDGPVVNANTKIVNIMDPAAALDAMGTDAGFRVIMNHIQSNPTAIKRALDSH